MDLSIKKKGLSPTGEGDTLHMDGKSVRYKETSKSLTWVSKWMVVPLTRRENIGKTADFVGKMTNSVLAR